MKVKDVYPEMKNDGFSFFPSVKLNQYLLSLNGLKQVFQSLQKQNTFRIYLFIYLFRNLKNNSSDFLFFSNLNSEFLLKGFYQMYKILSERLLVYENQKRKKKPAKCK